MYRDMSVEDKVVDIVNDLFGTEPVCDEFNVNNDNVSSMNDPSFDQNENIDSTSIYLFIINVKHINININIDHIILINININHIHFYCYIHDIFITKLSVRKSHIQIKIRSWTTNISDYNFDD